MNPVESHLAELPLDKNLQPSIDWTIFLPSLIIVILATTLDSAAYVLASISTRNLPGDQEPSKSNRLVWAFSLAFIAVGLLMVGGLKAVQSTSIIIALPMDQDCVGPLWGRV